MKKNKLEITEEMKKYGGSDPELLKRFINEFFDFSGLRKAGILTKEMIGDEGRDSLR